MKAEEIMAIAIFLMAVSMVIINLIEVFGNKKAIKDLFKYIAVGEILPLLRLHYSKYSLPLQHFFKKI